MVRFVYVLHHMHANRIFKGKSIKMISLLRFSLFMISILGDGKQKEGHCLLLNSTNGMQPFFIGKMIIIMNCFSIY